MMIHLIWFFTILPLASSQNLGLQITDPIPSQCLDAPCIYIGDCRSQDGVCGETAVHCNDDSTWVPACGGGAGLAKPIVTSPPLTAQPSIFMPDPVPTATMAPQSIPPKISPTTTAPTPTGTFILRGPSGTPGPTEDVGWFDPDSWDSGVSGQNSSSMKEGPKSQLLVLMTTVAVAWAML